MNPPPSDDGSDVSRNTRTDGGGAAISGDAVAAFQSVYDVTTNRDLSFEAKIDRLLSIGIEHLDLPYAFLSQISVEDPGNTEGTQTIYRAKGDHEALQPGETAPLSKAYCRKTIQSDELLAIQDAVAAGWADDPAYETFDLGSYIGGRVEVDDELYGTFCFASTEPKERTFSTEEQTLVKILAKWTSYELEQERARQRLEKERDDRERAQQELRQIIDLVPDLIFAKNREGQYLLANEATAAAYGRTPAEVEGTTESELIPELSQSDEFREDDLAVIESGEAKFIPEEELTTADGETRILETKKIPFEVPGTGEPAVLGYGRDVTTLKMYERKLEEQRDNLEVLSKVMRHDIRNDLQLVLAYAEMVGTEVDGEAKQYVEQILEAGRDAIDITTTAREVAEVLLQSDVDRRPIPLRHVIEAAVDDVRASNRSAVITLEEPIPAVAILADDMLESVFRNLLKNAVLHNDKGVPEVTIEGTIVGDAVKVTVRDNGPGIPDDRKEAIFEEGEMGLDSEGTGLGLYLVETLVTRYEGEVFVEDNLPEGAVFVVELPVAE